MEIHEETGTTGENQGGSRKSDQPSPRSSQFFQTLLDTIPSPIFFKNAQGRYLGCNDAFAGYLGRPREEIIGRTVYDIAPRELADVYRDKDQELFDHPGIQVYQTQARYGDGSLHDVIFHKATFHDADGRVGGLVGVLFDITDRKYRIVADNTYDWEFWLRPDGRFEYCSPSCERITGHAQAAFVADPDLLLRIIHPEDRRIFLDHRLEVKDGSVRCAGEIQFRLIRPDGSLRWIGHVCQPVFDSEGQFLGSRGSNRDITEQRQAEEALRASEERYRALIHQMTEGVALHEFICDENGVPRDFRFLEINPAFERLMSLKRADVVGRLVSEVVPSEAPAWIKLSSEVALTGKSAHFENYFPPMKKHFEVFAYCPAPRQFAVTLADITERKRSEQEREGLLSQLRAVIDHIDTGLIISDVQGHVLEMNPVARNLCGYATMKQVRRHSVDSQSLFDLMRPDGEPLAPENWPRMRTLRGETFDNWELRVRRKQDGTEGIISYGGTPVLDKLGRVILTVVTLRDVTERWNARQDLERKVRERTADLDRFNQTLQAIIDCNQAIIRASSEQELFQEFCRISMGVEGVDLAWAGLAEANQAKTVRPVAAMGFDMRELTQARISWADDAYGQGPAGTAIRTGRVCIKANSPTDPSLAIGREEDLNLGFGVSLALPLFSGGGAFGVLVLCSARPELFDENQVRMFRELANNLAIGIVARRTQTERDRALGMAESHAQQLRAMSLELAQTEQRERRRLAQVLHDNLQQLLVGATFNVEVLKGKIHAKALHGTLDQLSETIVEALGVSRAMTLELSPPIFYEKGLSDGLEWLTSQMHRKHGLKVAFEVVGDTNFVADPIRMFLFEAVRELLLNVVKHAKVDHARVRVRPLGQEEIEVTVTDEGVGFDATRIEGGEPSGFGLFSIREKLRFLHGRLRIETAPDQGSRFTLVVPCEGWQHGGDKLDTWRSRPSWPGVDFDGGAGDADQDPDSR